jgi:predicted transcriptional regulator
MESDGTNQTKTSRQSIPTVIIGFNQAGTNISTISAAGLLFSLFGLFCRHYFVGAGFHLRSGFPPNIETIFW